MEIVMQKKNEKDKILRNASRFRSIQFHVFSLIRKEFSLIFSLRRKNLASFRSRIISEIIVSPVTPLGDIVVLGGGIAIESEASFI